MDTTLMRLAFWLGVFTGAVLGVIGVMMWGG